VVCAAFGGFLGRLYGPERACAPRPLITWCLGDNGYILMLASVMTFCQRLRSCAM
jgi:hypothetical protein